MKKFKDYIQEKFNSKNKINKLLKELNHDYYLEIKESSLKIIWCKNIKKQKEEFKSKSKNTIIKEGKDFLILKRD